MTLMWLLLTVTVTCLCASPRCRSSPASLSFTAYCEKLCLWGRGGNLCHCNTAHFVGKRRDVRQQETDQDIQRDQLTGQNLGSNDDEELWNDDDNRDDDDALTAPDDWLDDENSTSADDVWAEQSRDPGSSVYVARADSRRRHQPAIFRALRRLGRRYEDAENSDLLLRDSAKKGERHGHLVVDEADDERRSMLTLNVLERKPMTFSLPPKTKQVLRKMASQSCEFHGHSQHLYTVAVAYA